MKSIITINGKQYDAVTGAPIAAPASAVRTRSYGSFDIKPAAGMHKGPDRSQTLRRTNVPKPVTAARPLASRHTRSISPITTHPEVSRFSRPEQAHTVSPGEVFQRSTNEGDTPIGLAVQMQNYTPAAKVSMPVRKAKAPAKPKSHAVTDHQVAKAKTHKEKAHHAKKTAPKVSPLRKIKLTPPLVISGVVVLLAIGITAAYFTVPALSLFVSAKSANVEASYPNYVPAGYHFKGPVSYRDGEVSMTFAANGSNKTFTILQRNSSWDSEAVLDNYVLARSGNYLTYSEKGLTIYTFGSDAAWINARVLHAISGDAHLTSDQILRIAASM
jgi:hypothetical protein